MSRRKVIVPGSNLGGSTADLAVDRSHATKLGFGKYFMWKMRHGYVGLP